MIGSTASSQAALQGGVAAAGEQNAATSRLRQRRHAQHARVWHSCSSCRCRCHSDRVQSRQICANGSQVLQVLKQLVQRDALVVRRGGRREDAASG